MLARMPSVMAAACHCQRCSTLLLCQPPTPSLPITSGRLVFTSAGAAAALLSLISAAMQHGATTPPPPAVLNHTPHIDCSTVNCYCGLLCHWSEDKGVVRTAGRKQ